MNLPNKLTISRILLTFVYMFFLFKSGILSKYIALFIFIIASLTDLYDGRIARKKNLITNFGKIMDPIADKVLILASFLAFVELKIVPAWMVAIIIWRELTITSLRLFAASRSIILAAEREGKHKTVSQFIAIISILVYLILRDTFLKFGLWNISSERILSIIIYSSMVIVMVLTIYSGINFFWKNRKVIA